MGVPAPAVAAGGPPELRFINPATLDRLVDSSDSSPMAAVAFLTGSLEPCFTQAILADERSTVRAIAVRLHANLARNLDTATAASASSDPLLAMQLRAFVLSSFRSLGKTRSDLCTAETPLSVSLS